MTILLNNVDTDTPSDEFASKGGTAIITVRATDFGSATLEIQTASSSDSLNRFLVLPNGTFLTDGTILIDNLPQGIIVKADLTGTTGSTDDVFVDILQ